MKMTLDEALSCPKGMSMEEYAKSLAKLKRQRTQLAKLIDKRYDLEDKLDVLEDEAGSERWKRTKAELEEINIKIEKLWEKM